MAGDRLDPREGAGDVPLCSRNEGLDGPEGVRVRELLVRGDEDLPDQNSPPEQDLKILPDTPLRARA